MKESVKRAAIGTKRQAGAKHEVSPQKHVGQAAEARAVAPGVLGKRSRAMERARAKVVGPYKAAEVPAARFVLLAAEAAAAERKRLEKAEAKKREVRARYK